jgi:hypothetical protein
LEGVQCKQTLQHSSQRKIWQIWRSHQTCNVVWFKIEFEQKKPVY